MVLKPAKTITGGGGGGFFLIAVGSWDGAPMVDDGPSLTGGLRFAKDFLSVGSLVLCFDVDLARSVGGSCDLVAPDESVGCEPLA
jgi:hypothetical protein